MLNRLRGLLSAQRVTRTRNGTRSPSLICSDHVICLNANRARSLAWRAAAGTSPAYRSIRDEPMRRRYPPKNRAAADFCSWSSFFSRPTWLLLMASPYSARERIQAPTTRVFRTIDRCFVLNTPECMIPIMAFSALAVREASWAR
ncbi:hypothetical protein PBRA_009703 [Plasmodiophora brassicae]|uniref:Uncharacterized protein n=1 Tax=Plasmodiophora brassicae TaxID=37360 RepID=A0A0G4IL68_PLABS|nr:hypothetical protein PBRA_009703 [Plasmodiophora brassicae]